MKREITSFAGRLRRDESGAVFILVAIGIVAILGLGALAIDVGRIVYAQRALQATTDLAAQAGATEIYNGSGISATATVTSYYNAKSGGYNFQNGLNVTSVSATLEAVNGNKPGGCPTGTALQYYPACTASSPNGTSSGGVRKLLQRRLQRHCGDAAGEGVPDLRRDLPHGTGDADGKLARGRQGRRIAAA